MLSVILLLATIGAAGQALAQEPAKALGNAPTSYEAITGQRRANWALKSTIGPESLASGLFTAGFGAAINGPHEYGPHWEGFGKRYGMRFTGIATGNVMEATIGVLWQEDRATSPPPASP